MAEASKLPEALMSAPSLGPWVELVLGQDSGSMVVLQILEEG